MSNEIPLQINGGTVEGISFTPAGYENVLIARLQNSTEEFIAKPRFTLFLLVVFILL